MLGGAYEPNCYVTRLGPIGPQFTPNPQKRSSKTCYPFHIADVNFKHNFSVKSDYQNGIKGAVRMVYEVYLNAFNLSNGGGASQFLYVSEIAVGRVCDYSYLNAFNLSNGGGASQFLYVSEIAVGRVCFYSYLNAFNLSNGGGASQLGL